MKQLDDLTQRFHDLRKRWEKGQVSPREYFEETNRIGLEYIRLLDSFEAKPLDQLEVSVR